MLHTITKAIVKGTHNLLDTQYVDDVAKRIYAEIEQAAGPIDPDIPSGLLDDPEVEDYLGLAVDSFLTEKVDIPVDRLKSEMGLMDNPEDFQKLRGYSDTEIDNYNVFLELGEEVDPTGDMLVPVQHHLESVRSFVNRFKPLSFKRTDTEGLSFKTFKGDEPEEADVSQLAEYLGNNVLNSVADDARLMLGPNSPKVIGKLLVDKLMSDPQYSKTIRDMAKELPKPSKPDTSLERLPDFRIKAALQSFLQGSKVKVPVYRATFSFNELEGDIAAALPRELGIHVGGSRGQAMSIIALREGGDLGHVPKFNRAFSPNELPKAEEFDNYFTNNFDASRPFMITKGYINLKNPFRMQDQDQGWFFGRSLTRDRYSKAFFEAVKAQKGGPITKPQVEAFDNIVKEAKAFDNPMPRKAMDSNDPLLPSPKSIGNDHGVYLDRIRNDITNIKINRDLRDWLKDLGFDGVEYDNAVEAAIDGESTTAYILFDNTQYKTVWSRAFDPKDPRHNYNDGGLVEFYEGETTQPAPVQLNFTPQAMSDEYYRANPQHRRKL